MILIKFLRFHSVKKPSGQLFGRFFGGNLKYLACRTAAVLVGAGGWGSLAWGRAAAADGGLQLVLKFVSASLLDLENLLACGLRFHRFFGRFGVLIYLAI